MSIRFRRQCSQGVYELPNMLVRLGFARHGHAAQTDAILHDPEGLAVRIALHFGAGQSAALGYMHPPTSISLGAFNP